MSYRSGHSGSCRPRRLRRLGLTLIEMLVTITILVILLMAFGSILTSSQRAVSASQDVMKGNNAVTAVASLLREDLVNFAPEGFVAISRDAAGNDRLVFTTAGTYKSMVDATIANCARIEYGVTNDSDRILWRRAVLLNPHVASAGDHEQVCLADYKLYDHAGLLGILNPFFTDPAGLTPSPNSLAQLSDNWPFVAQPCSRLEVDWTPSLLDPNDPNNPGDWYSCPTGQTRLWPGEEYDPVNYDVGEYVKYSGAYHVCMTATSGAWNPANWEDAEMFPEALRIRFRVGDGETFELIVKLGKN